MRRGVLKVPPGSVFTMVADRPTAPRSLNRMLTMLCRKAQVRRVRVHDLRHTCASLLLAQGVDVHVMDSTLRAAAERMEDALGTDDGGNREDGEGGVPAAA